MRFLALGTLAGGVVLFILNWLTAAVLPPRYRQFQNPAAVVDAIGANASDDDIYTARQGLFVAVSLRRHLPLGVRLASQLIAEFAVALGLSILVSAARFRGSAASLGLAGLIAGLEVHFPNWNWSGFPPSATVAGCGYLAANWFVTGLVLADIRKRLS